MGDLQMSRYEFGKITRQIYDSSIFFTGPVNRSIFMDSVVLSEADNVVHMGLRAFAKATGWTLEQVREAARVHMSPDPESRTKTMEGRRWMWVDSENEEAGFLVVNRDIYKRESPDQEKARRRKYAKDRRDQERSNHINVITDNVTIVEAGRGTKKGSGEDGSGREGE